MTVTDTHGNTNTCTRVVNIFNNTPPSISCPADITIDCSQNPLDTANTTNAAVYETNCQMGILSFTDVEQPSLNGCYEIHRTWMVETPSGVQSQCTQIITIADDTPPVFDDATIPLDTVLDCQNAMAYLSAPVVLTATDNCNSISSADIVIDTIINAQDVDPADCGHYEYRIIRTWAIEVDSCNAPVTATQIITVQDTTEVSFSFPDTLVLSNNTGSCDAQVNLDLSNYIQDDCAPFANLMITNTIRDELGNIVMNGNGTNDIDGLYDVGFYTIYLIVLSYSSNVINIEV